MQPSSPSQSCPTLRNPMDCSLPGSSVHGIFPWTEGFTRDLPGIYQGFTMGFTRDGGAYWAAIYGVTQSWTRLKRLSSSSSSSSNSITIYFQNIFITPKRNSIPVEKLLVPPPSSPPGLWPQISSVQFCRQSCLTLCDPMDCSTSGFPVHHQLPQLAQTHVH